MCLGKKIKNHIIYIFFLYDSHPCVEAGMKRGAGDFWVDDDDGKLIAEKCDYDLEIKF